MYRIAYPLVLPRCPFVPLVFVLLWCTFVLPCCSLCCVPCDMGQAGLLAREVRLRLGVKGLSGCVCVPLYYVCAHM